MSQKKTVPKVTLIGVTKTLSLEHTELAIKAGITDIGENRLQNAGPKMMVLKEKYAVTWHFIGSAQKNKLKKIVKLFDFIHSVDSFEKLELINKFAKEENKIMPILLQVNTSREESKHGFSSNNLKEQILNILGFKNIDFKGYMTMAPFIDNETIVRNTFRELKTLAEEIKQRGINYQHLSMGMSNDFEIALEEGATMIRIGTKLFHN